MMQNNEAELFGFRFCFVKIIRIFALHSVGVQTYGNIKALTLLSIEENLAVFERTERGKVNVHVFFRRGHYCIIFCTGTPRPSSMIMLALFTLYYCLKLKLNV